MRLCVVVLNYRRGDLTVGCLESLASELAGHDDRCAVVVDNGSDDGSGDMIEQAIQTKGWGDRIRLIRSPVNGGFAAGNNLGFKEVNAAHYLLLNSDARVTAGALDQLLEIADEHPEAGLVGPRLQGPEGDAQVSCFRYRSPVSEMLAAAATGPLGRLLRGFVVAMGVYDEPVYAQWVSYACVLIRREVIDQVGLMDESYFMYFEDIDYSRQVQEAGWKVLHHPAPRVVHLRGGSSSVKSAMKQRRRVPRYYYESRSRYFAKYYGGVAGLCMTNILWLTGRTISFLRELVGNKQPHTCEAECRDNWINWRHPMRPPHLPSGGDL